jgi:hypothetical protein
MKERPGHNPHTFEFIVAAPSPWGAWSQFDRGIPTHTDQSLRQPVFNV